MKYETPELTALTPAINAIQTTDISLKSSSHKVDSQPGTGQNDASSAYADWE
jgi:hypothetical protein